MAIHMSPEPQNLSVEQAIDLALVHQNAGQFSQAEDIYRKILNVEPDHHVALHMLGKITCQTGDLEGAEVLINKAIVLRPDYAQAHNSLGIILNMMGRPEEAVSCYRKALSILPNLPEASYNLGKAFFNLGRLEDAVTSYEETLVNKPTFIEAHNNLGIVFFELGRLDDAVASYLKALAIDPNYTDAIYNLGNTYRDQGLLDDATSCYHKTLTLKPDHTKALFNLHALLYGEDDNFGAAAQCLEKALMATPEDMKCRFFLGMLRDRQGQDKTAAGHFKRLSKESDTDRCRLDSWDYVKSVAGISAPLYGNICEGLRRGLNAASLEGLVLELGVQSGTACTRISTLANQDVHRFDTFQDTLPSFLEGHAGPIRFMTVTLDQYASTKTALDLLADRIIAGTVIVFSKYLAHPTWRNDQFKAFQDAVKSHGWTYDYLGFDLLSNQAVGIIR